jgi:hypothetical protein
MMRELRFRTVQLEFLWGDQGDHEIAADGEGDGEAEDDFKHLGLSDAGDEPRIKREKAEGAEAYGEEDDVGHGWATSVGVEVSHVRPDGVRVRLGRRGWGVRIL